jgi:hypothetical protein
MESLVSILRDPMTRTLVSVLAICVTISSFLWAQRLRRKAFSYTISPTRVLSVHEEVKGRVQILFDGAPAIDVSLFMITLNNSGGEPIRAEDFERPVRCQWQGPAQILTADVVEVGPTSLRPVIKTSVSEIVLEPLLLNGGDWLKIKALVNESGTGACSVDGRIVGVKKLEHRTVDPNERLLKTLTGAVIGLPILMLPLMLAGHRLGLWAMDGPVAKSLAILTIICIVMFLLEILKLTIKGLLETWCETKYGSK